MSMSDPQWDPRIESAALTDIGMRRSNNQDSHALVLAGNLETWKRRGHFLMVADGMGAHAAGELASKLAVDGVAHLYQKYTENSPPEALERALTETNSEVHRRGQVNSDFRNMGTTASVLVLLPQGALVAHIGDSRVYRLRGASIEQLTFDHSLVWELKKTGQFNEESDLAQAIPKNVITRSLGPNASVQVDIEGPFPTQKDDVYLLCSDGLTGRLQDDELAAVIAQLSADEAAQLLIDLANLRGGPDNITVLVARIQDDEVASDQAGKEPLRVGGSRHNPALEPLLWVTISVFLLIGLVLAITNRPLSAFISVLLGAGAYGLARYAKRKAERSGVSLSGDRRLGKGPYTETPCPSAEDASDLLKRLTEEVRAQANSSTISIDWGGFDQACQEADQARQSADFPRSVKLLAHAIRVLMVELRSEQEQQASDSALDL